MFPKSQSRKDADMLAYLIVGAVLVALFALAYFFFLVWRLLGIAIRMLGVSLRATRDNTAALREFLGDMNEADSSTGWICGVCSHFNDHDENCDSCGSEPPWGSRDDSCEERSYTEDDDD